MSIQAYCLFCLAYAFSSQTINTNTSDFNQLIQFPAKINSTNCIKIFFSIHKAWKEMSSQVNYLSAFDTNVKDYMINDRSPLHNLSIIQLK